MDFERIKSLLAVPLAALFVLSTLVAFGIRQQASAGVSLHIYPVRPDTLQSGSCPNREIVVRLTADGKYWINETEIAPFQLPMLLAEIFENRADRSVYVFAESSISIQQFSEFFNRISFAAPGLKIILVSGNLRRAIQSGMHFGCIA